MTSLIQMQMTLKAINYCNSWNVSFVRAGQVGTASAGNCRTMTEHTRQVPRIRHYHWNGLKTRTRTPIIQVLFRIPDVPCSHLGPEFICRCKTFSWCQMYLNPGKYQDTESYPNFIKLFTVCGEETTLSRVMLQKLTVPQLVKIFPAFYGTQSFVTGSAIACLFTSPGLDQCSPRPAILFL